MEGIYIEILLLIKILVALGSIVFLLHRRISIGNAMLAGTLSLYLFSSPTLAMAGKAANEALLRNTTWEVILAMYFVMCLEYLLRTSGTLENFMISIGKLFGSGRFLLALMPAFLGFLPSVGGALFSAPLVESAGKRYNLTSDAKTAINYWFRHIWEFSNPIIPGLILASQISGISLGTLIIHFSVYTLLGMGLGWFVLLTGDKFKNKAQGLPEDLLIESSAETVFQVDTRAAKEKVSYRYIFLAIGPILANILLVVIFHLSAAVSMAVVVTTMIILLGQKGKDIFKMLKYAFDIKLIWGILNIFLFQQILTATGTIDGVVLLMRNSGVPLPVMIGFLTFIVGMLTGQVQSFVAVTFPIIAVIAPGSISLVAIGYVMGVVGNMLSPTHLCLVLTLKYYNANFLKSLKPIILMEFVIATLVFILNY